MAIINKKQKEVVTMHTNSYKKFLFTILALVLFMDTWWPGIVTHAESDTNPPTLNALSLSQNTIEAGQSVQVTADVSDDVSGVKTVSIYFKPPAGNANKYISLKLNAATGKYEGVFQTGQNDAQGNWSISQIYLVDNVGNNITILNGTRTTTIPYWVYQDLSQYDINVTAPTDHLSPVTQISLQPTSPYNGWFRNNITVTLNATDDFSGVAQTVYQMNNGDWQTYTGPFMISDEGVYTINYKSTDNIGQEETVKSASIKLDKTAPITTPGGLTNGYYNATGIVLSALDSLSSINYTDYNIPQYDSSYSQRWYRYTAPIQFSKSGQYTLRFYSVNAAGITEQTQTITVNYDNKAPTITTGLDAEWYGDLSLYLSTTDDYSGVAKTEYRLNNGDWKPYTEMISITNEGTNQFDITSTDNAGNVATVSKVINIDHTPPKTGVDQTNTEWTKDTVTLHLNASDNLSGVSKTEYRLNNGDWQTYDTSITVSSSGKNQLEYRSIDTAGNMEETQTLPINIDKTAPTTTITPVKNMWVNGNIVFNLVGNDPLSGVSKTEYQINNGAWQKYIAPVILSNQGQYQIHFRSTDKLGNVETTKTASYKIDKLAPNTTASPVKSTWYRSNVTINLQAKDNLSGILRKEYRINKGSWTKYYNPITVSTQGTNTVEYRSIDNAGNVEGSKKLTVRIDKTKPSLSFSFNHSTLSGKSHKMTLIKVKLSAKDSLSGVSTYKLLSISSNQVDKVKGKVQPVYSGAKFGTADTSFYVKAQRTGSHNRTYKVTYQVIDKAGNTSTKSGVITVKK
ncbi:OmpL47-type beta-barrel domain-containing protein [Neobacillus drentensis]|uniref:OmpL47-type beta-barrel domain-containing protein n=1 Tax=Neobacillus drentensis TaxID=220684 RepID=UPI002FFF78C2